MQFQSTQLSSLLGAIVISSGLASSLAIAQDSTAEQASTIESTTNEQVQELEQSNDLDMVEVRISMPDGRIIIRKEPVAQRSTKRIAPVSIARSRTLADGSRVSTARSGVSGGANSSSVQTGSSGASGSSGGSSGGGARSGGGGGGASSSAEIETPSTKSSGGVYSRSSSSNDDTSTSSSTHSTSSQSSSPRSVPTIGSPSYSQDGATGGQRVEFHDAGMGAAVIGNTVYFTGVEFVQVNQGCGVVTGTRLGSDAVRLDDMRLASSSSNPLSSWNIGASTIKLDFESDTVVDLVMHSITTDANNPSRDQRTWTVRIR